MIRTLKFHEQDQIVIYSITSRKRNTGKTWKKNLMEALDSTLVASTSEISSPRKVVESPQELMLPSRVSSPPFLVTEPQKEIQLDDEYSPVAPDSNGNKVVCARESQNNFRPARMKTGMCRSYSAPIVNRFSAEIWYNNWYVY